MKRQLSPYEKTHLKRFGQTQAQRNLKISDYGEMPIEYITGRVEFMDWVFAVNESVMIPRIESEELIKLALEKIMEMGQEKIHLADVGCGCGALGISLYLELQKRGFLVKLILSDVSAAALGVAQKNVSRLVGEDENIKLIESDLLTNYPAQTQPVQAQFDLILANLPYIPSGRIKVLQDSVKKYEPWLALDGGEDGLSLIRPFIKQAKNKLKKNGKILLEVDHTHDKQFLQNKLELDDLKLEVRDDQFGRSRFASCSIFAAVK